jgi:hypothetical protein
MQRVHQQEVVQQVHMAVTLWRSESRSTFRGPLGLGALEWDDRPSSRLTPAHKAMQLHELFFSHWPGRISRGA